MGRLDVRRLLYKSSAQLRYWPFKITDHHNSAISDCVVALPASHSVKAPAFLQVTSEILSCFPALPGAWSYGASVYGCAPTGARILTAWYFHWFWHSNRRCGSLGSDSGCLLSLLNAPRLGRRRRALFLLPRPLLAHTRRRSLLAGRWIIFDSRSLRSRRTDAYCPRR